MSLIPYLVTRFINMCRMLFQKLLGQLIMLSLEFLLEKGSVCDQLFEAFNSIHRPVFWDDRGAVAKPYGLGGSSCMVKNEGKGRKMTGHQRHRKIVVLLDILKASQTSMAD